MTKRIFKRKVYDKLLEWKKTSAGTSTLLLQGARRIGKSTIVEEFAKNEYSSYLLRLQQGFGHSEILVQRPHGP